MSDPSGGCMCALVAFEDSQRPIFSHTELSICLSRYAPTVVAASLVIPAAYCARFVFALRAFDLQTGKLGLFSRRRMSPIFLAFRTPVAAGVRFGD